MGGGGLALGGLQCGVGRGHRRLGVAQLLGRNGLGREQRLAAGELRLSLLKFRAATVDLRIKLRRRRRLLAHLAHGEPQRTGSPLQRDLGVGRVKSHQHLADIDALRVVGQHLDHRAGDLGGDADLVATDISIVSGLALGEHQHPQQQPADADQQENADDDCEDPAALAVGRRSGCGGGIRFVHDLGSVA